MPIRLEGPPLREPMVDKNGNINRHWARWFSSLHLKTGGSEAALPVSLGGTGANSTVGAIAMQTSSSSSGGGSSSSAVTKRQTFTLNSPGSPTVGDSETTTVVWATPFADANYTVTADFSDTASGRIVISAITAAGFTITLFNRLTRIASGTADCIGVHP